MLHTELSAPQVEQTFEAAINNLTRVIAAQQVGGSATEMELPLPTDLLSKDPRGLLLAQLQQLHEFRISTLDVEAARIMALHGITEEQAAQSTKQIVAAQAAAAEAAPQGHGTASAVEQMLKWLKSVPGAEVGVLL
jgi:hypothetical protein